MAAASLLVLLGAAAWLGIRYVPEYETPIVAASRGMLHVEISGPGALEALQHTTIAARAVGRLTRLHVEDGDRVVRGQVVAEIASEEPRSQHEAASASAQAAEWAAGQARAGVEQALASLDRAASEFSRQQRLLPEGATSRAAYDTSQTSLRLAEADLARARATLEQADMMAAAAGAQTKAVGVALQDTTVRAPYDGVIVSRTMSIGDMATVGAPILRIAAPGSVVFSARLDESAISRILPGQAASIVLASQPDEPVPATVVRFEREVDAATREFSVVLDLQDLPANWAIGQRGQARIIVDEAKDALTVPENFVVRRGQMAGLWVVEDGRARWREPEFGRRGGGRVEITSGVAAGELIASPSDLYDGKHLRAPRPQ